MRTIKFRGYNTKNKEWLYGYLFKCNGEYLILSEDEESDRTTFSNFVVEPESIGQFTGLYDIYNKPIYEGDILSLMDEFGVECFRLVKYDICYDSLSSLYEFLKCDSINEFVEEFNIKIEGNIYNNPELYDL